MKWALPKADTYFAPLLRPDGFQIEHLLYALRFVKNYNVAIDGGAHIGTWTVAMARAFARVYAYEPARDTFECLKTNIAAAGLASKVEAFNAALGPGFGLVAVMDDPTRPGNTGARQVGLAKTTNKADELAVQVCIDSLNLDCLDFLKLDVEGYEIEALQGALITLRRCHPVIMLECKSFVPPRHGGPKECVKLLSSLRYIEIGGMRNDRVFVYDR